MSGRVAIAPVMVEEIKKLMKTYVDYPPRKLQSLGYTGPITISNYQKFEWVREQLKKDADALWQLIYPSKHRTMSKDRREAVFLFVSANVCFWPKAGLYR
jgi:hypothetical protein